jgi:hypothetical protein
MEIENVKEIKIENGEVWVKIDKEARIELGQKLIEGFLTGGKKELLDEALMILSGEEFGEAVRELTYLEHSNGLLMKGLADNLEFFEKYVPELKERIRDNFKYIFDELGAEEIFEVAKKVNGEEDLKGYILDRIRYAQSIDLMKKEAEFFSKVYPDVIKRLAEEKVAELLDMLSDNYFLEELNRGRGYYLEGFIRVVMLVEQLKDFIGDRKAKMLQKALLANIDLIRKVVKRRSKLERHHPYLKAIVSLLPEEYKKDFIPYFI